jgi:hypothetical protein
MPEPKAEPKKPAEKPLPEYYSAMQGPLIVPSAVSSGLSQDDAQKIRQDYVLPPILPGETVFYLPKQSTQEQIAIFIRRMGQTALIELSNGIQVKSVCHHDHLATPEDKVFNDPWAAFNTYGTFRRSEFGKMLVDFVKSLPTLPANAALVRSLEARIASLEKALGGK